MTQEDWSGTGEASNTSSAGSWNEPAADAEEALGESAIDEVTESAERTVAVPATTRSSSRSSRSSRSSGARKKSTAKKSTAKRSAAKKSTAKRTTAKKSTSKRPAAKKAAAKRPAAKKSAAWYADFRSHMRLAPLDLAFSYITRSGRVDPERLRAMSPGFMAGYESRTQTANA